MKTKHKATACAGLLALFAAMMFAAPLAQAGETNPAISEDVDRILKDMQGSLENADELSFHAEILFDEIIASGQALQHGADLKVAVKRPGKLAARFESDRGMRTMWINGKTATVYHNDKEACAETKVPGKIDESLDFLMEKYDFSLPLADFVSKDVYKSLTGNIQRALYVGKALVNGQSCDHIAVREELIDWQLWVDDGIDRLPRKIVITYKSVPGAPVYMATFAEWNLAANLPERLFQPNLPVEVVEIDILEVEREKTNK